MRHDLKPYQCRSSLNQPSNKLGPKSSFSQAVLPVLGLDPGTVRTGFALLVLQGKKLSLADIGVLKARASAPLQTRLLTIGQALEELYQKHLVAHTALERVFLGKNPDSSFKLGQAFGLCSYQAVRHGSEVFSYPARSVKQVVTGSGRADKELVKHFVLNTFGLKKRAFENDATDALAVALCHLRTKYLTLPDLKKARQLRTL